MRALRPLRARPVDAPVRDDRRLIPRARSTPTAAACSSAAARTATSQGTNAGPFTDVYLRGYDTAGTSVWTRQWGQEGDDQVLSVAADSTGVTAVGYTHADATGNAPSQAFIRRFDRDGHF